MSGNHATGDRPAGNGQRPPVLVTDRARAFAEALADLLDAAGCPAVSAPFDEARDACRAHAPAVLVLDGDGPPEEMLEIAEAARAARGDVRVVLLLCAGTRPPSRLGADRVVSRQSGIDEVLEAVRGVRTHHNGHRARRDARAAAGTSPLDRLTPRERQVLQALMAGGRSTTIAEALGISPHTVRTHVQNTFAKLAVSTRLEAASIARDAGLRPLPLTEAGAEEPR